MNAHRIVVTSPNGGTGKTTLAANLSVALARAGHRCMAFDLDPQNALGLHFGVQPGSGMGIIHHDLSGRALADHLRRTRAPYAFLPFGHHHEADRIRAEEILTATPDWLAQRLIDLSPPHCDYIVLDTPSGRSPWLRRALQVADLVLVVLLPDAASFAALPQLEHFARTVADVPQERIYFLVNQFDPRRPLACDTLDALHALLGDRVLPGVIQEDEAVREQLARQQPLSGNALSQAALDIERTAHWIRDVLATDAMPQVALAS